jgi:5'-3' exonuclease
VGVLPLLLPLPLYTRSTLQPAPTTEREVFLNIFDYIDRLFAIVRPRRLLYMAIGEAAEQQPLAYDT